MLQSFSGVAHWLGSVGYEPRFNTMTPQTFTFTDSSFWPIAIGFFGLGTGYFIWGGQALFGYPKASPEVDRTMGMWGFWMPGAGGRQRSHSRDDRPLAQRGNTIQHNSPDGASRRSSPDHGRSCAIATGSDEPHDQWHR